MFLFMNFKIQRKRVMCASIQIIFQTLVIIIKNVFYFINEFHEIFIWEFVIPDEQDCNENRSHSGCFTDFSANHGPTTLLVVISMTVAKVFLLEIFIWCRISLFIIIQHISMEKYFRTGFPKTDFNLCHQKSQIKFLKRSNIEKTW